MGAPVYCVFLCGTNKLEPKKPEALAGCSLCTAAPFLVWEPQTNFFYLRTTRLRIVGLIDEISTKKDSYWRKDYRTFFNLRITRSARNKLLWALRYANVSLGCRHRSELVGSARKRPISIYDNCRRSIVPIPRALYPELLMLLFFIFHRTISCLHVSGLALWHYGKLWDRSLWTFEAFWLVRRWIWQKDQQ